MMSSTPARPDDDLKCLLGELRVSERSLEAPARTEQAVLAAWDAQRTPGAPNGTPSSPSLYWRWLAVAAAVVGALVVTRLGREPVAETGASNGQVDGGAGWEWLDPDPGSLRVVRLRVPSDRVDGAGLPADRSRQGDVVDIEVIVGEDGLARSVRVASVQ